ncbi:MAG: hypothetical protein K6G01_08950 [Eubacterium sp.]|nr:hypothetical protein [Eubacterium sp.]
MQVLEQIEQLRHKANENQNLRRQILQTKYQDDPLVSFCNICRQEGYELYPMDIVVAGEELYARMKRSTNGGGENSPVLSYEDDIYEMLVAALKQVEEGIKIIEI